MPDASGRGIASAGSAASGGSALTGTARRCTGAGELGAESAEGAASGADSAIARSGRWPCSATAGGVGSAAGAGRLLNGRLRDTEST
ncbi:MAG TPA: hypothetical protein PJ994_05890, partial [Tepidiformaceae bacterium]|nr:hypothetical protein [Tepidiformaceae bacterium]